MIDYGELEALRTIGQPRSSHWPAVEKAHLAESPACACCTTASSTAKQQVHHVWPFHYCIALGRPDLELDPRNLITLCEDESGAANAQDHHLLVGHLADFSSSNIDVVEDARSVFHGMSASAIRANALWRSKVVQRLRPLDQMTDEDKAAFIARMNKELPRP